VPVEFKTTKLSLDPSTVPTEVATYLTGQAEPVNAALFGESAGTTDYRDTVAEFAFTGWPSGFTPTFTATPTAHEVLVFPLKDGSALVAFGLKTTLHVTAGNPLPDEALDQTTDQLDPRIAPGLYWEITFEDLESFTVLVPTTKSGDLLTALPVLYGSIAARGQLVSDPSQYG
jgi:hypothetical protein